MKNKKFAKLITSVALALTMCVSGVIAVNSFNKTNAAEATVNIAYSDYANQTLNASLSSGATFTYGTRDLRVSGTSGIGKTEAEARAYKNGTVTGYVFNAIPGNLGAQGHLTLTDAIDVSNLTWTDENNFDPLISLTMPATSIGKATKNGADNYFPYSDLSLILININDAEGGGAGITLSITPYVDGSHNYNIIDNCALITFKSGKSTIPYINRKGEATAAGVKDYWSFGFSGKQDYPFSIAISNNKLYFGKSSVGDCTNHCVINDITPYIKSSKVKIDIWYGDSSYKTNGTTINGTTFGTGMQTVGDHSGKADLVISALGGVDFQNDKSVKVSDLTITANSDLNVRQGSEFNLTAPIIKYNGATLNTKRLVAKVDGKTLAYNGADVVTHTFTNDTVVEYYQNGTKVFTQNVTVIPTITVGVSDVSKPSMSDSFTDSYGTIDLRVNSAYSIGSTEAEALAYRSGSASGLIMASTVSGNWAVFNDVYDLSKFNWNGPNDYDPIFSFYTVSGYSTIIKYKQNGATDYSYLPFPDMHGVNLYIADATDSSKKMQLEINGAGSGIDTVTKGIGRILFKYQNSTIAVTNSDGSTLAAGSRLSVKHSMAGTSAAPLSICITKDALYIPDIASGTNYKIIDNITNYFPSGKVKLTFSQGGQTTNGAGAAVTWLGTGSECTLVNSAPSTTYNVITALGGADLSAVVTGTATKVSDLTITTPTYSAVDYGAKVTLASPTLKYGPLNINTKKLVAKIGDSKLAFRGATSLVYYFYKDSTIEYFYDGVKVCESTINVNKTGIIIDETDIKKLTLATNSLNVAYGVEDLKYMGQLGGQTSASRLRFDSAEDATNYTNGQKAGLVFTGGATAPYYMQVQINEQVDLSTLYYNSPTDYAPLIGFSSTPGTGIVKFKNNGVNDGDAEYSYAPYKTLSKVVLYIRDAANGSYYLKITIISSGAFENMYSNSCTSGITIKGNKNDAEQTLTFKGRDGSDKTTDYYSYSFVGSQMMPFGLTIANNALYIGESGVNNTTNHKLLDDVSEYFPSGKAIAQLYYSDLATGASDSSVGSYGSDTSWVVAPETTAKTVITAYGGKSFDNVLNANEITVTADDTIYLYKGKVSKVTAPTLATSFATLNTNKLVAKIGSNEIAFNGADSINYTFNDNATIEYYYDGYKVFTQTVEAGYASSVIVNGGTYKVLRGGVEQTISASNTIRLGDVIKVIPNGVNFADIRYFNVNFNKNGDNYEYTVANDCIVDGVVTVNVTLDKKYVISVFDDVESNGVAGSDVAIKTETIWVGDGGAFKFPYEVTNGTTLNYGASNGEKLLVGYARTDANGGIYSGADLNVNAIESDMTFVAVYLGVDTETQIKLEKGNLNNSGFRYLLKFNKVDMANFAKYDNASKMHFYLTTTNELEKGGYVGDISDINATHLYVNGEFASVENANGLGLYNGKTPGYVYLETIVGESFNEYYVDDTYSAIGVTVRGIKNPTLNYVFMPIISVNYVDGANVLKVVDAHAQSPVGIASEKFDAVCSTVNNGAIFSYKDQNGTLYYSNYTMADVQWLADLANKGLTFSKIN